MLLVRIRERVVPNSQVRKREVWYVCGLLGIRRRGSLTDAGQDTLNVNRSYVFHPQFPSSLPLSSSPSPFPRPSRSSASQSSCGQGRRLNGCTSSLSSQGESRRSPGNGAGTLSRTMISFSPAWRTVLRRSEKQVSLWKPQGRSILPVLWKERYGNPVAR